MSSPLKLSNPWEIIKKYQIETIHAISSNSVESKKRRLSSSSMAFAMIKDIFEFVDIPE